MVSDINKNNAILLLVVLPPKSEYSLDIWVHPRPRYNNRICYMAMDQNLGS